MGRARLLKVIEGGLLRVWPEGETLTHTVYLHPSVVFQTLGCYLKLSGLDHFRCIFFTTTFLNHSDLKVVPERVGSPNVVVPGTDGGACTDV